VFPVGQGIDEKIFQSNVVPKLDAKNVSFFNYGRLDSSKRADLLVLVVSQLRRESTNFKLTFYGQTLENSPQWLTKIHELQSDLNLRPWLNFELPLEQNEIRDALLKHDIFIHAFHGSLDKTLIETTMMQKPVITCNEEYLEIFGSWSGLDKSQIDDLNFLIFEVKTLLSLSKNHVAEEIVRRYQMAITNHSLSSWAVAVSHILTGTGQLA
jgi:hypothetical protein